MNYLLEAKDAVPGELIGDDTVTALNLRARSSSITCLAGPSLLAAKIYLRMLAGLYAPKQGHVDILDTTTDQLAPHTWQYLRTHTGYVTGNTPLLSAQDGLANIMLPALYHDIAPVDEAETKAYDLLRLLGCESDIKVLPAFMSTIERVLVSLARALILEPRILYLEHPFQNLSAAERRQLARALAELREKKSLCIIAAVENLAFIKEYADQIVFTSNTAVQYFQNWDAMLGSRDVGVQTYLHDDASNQLL